MTSSENGIDAFVPSCFLWLDLPTYALVTLEDLLRDLSSGKKLKKLVSSDTKKRRAAKAPVAGLFLKAL